MTNLDLICAADDQHRVALLADLLAQSMGIADWTVTVRQAVPSGAASPLLVAWTARASDVAAITGLFGSGQDIVVACLDDTPLPGPCLRAVRLQRWPARSADRKVVALARWLRRPGIVQVPEPGADRGQPRGASRHNPSVPAAADDSSVQPGRRASPTGGHAGRPRRGIGDRASALALITLVVLGGILFLSAEPAPRRAGAAAEPQPEELAGSLPGEPGPDVSDGLADSGPDQPLQRPAGAVSSAEGGPGADRALGLTPAESAQSPADPRSAPADPSNLAIAAAGAGLAVEAEPAPQPEWEAAPEIVLHQPVRDDALSRLCAAATPAAARAWSLALDWKQRRRARVEPCVRALLARPAFADLALAVAPL